MHDKPERPRRRRDVTAAGLVAALLAGLLVAAGPVRSDSAEDWVRSLEHVRLVIRSEGEARTLTARLADEPGERARGMQHLAPETIRANPIWFVFDSPQRTGWHMRNVRLALDIAYVNADGRVLAVERMEPGGSGYGIDRPIRYALEVAAGRAEALGLRPGATINPR